MLQGLSSSYKEYFMELAKYFYTSSQAALKLGVSRVTIWRWVKGGKFTAQIIGREALIPKWEIDLIELQPNREKS